MATPSKYSYNDAYTDERSAHTISTTDVNSQKSLRTDLSDTNALAYDAVKSFSIRDGPARTKKETETIPKNLAEVISRIQQRHEVSYPFSRWKILRSVV